ncbi:MAG: carboxypeptidase regulatory-like domain-containing protein, partial [Bacteroidetes bacterium]|nr:carboxypeptidase regulatory-like domain-containing protein [Bacteroidota bacterium]
MKSFFILVFASAIVSINAQTKPWVLKLSSTVEYRSFVVKAGVLEPEDKPLGGATIALIKDGVTVKQATSSGNGDFTIDVPQDGEYIMEVSYSECNSKKFMINTKNVPQDKASGNFKMDIQGVIMAKPLYSIDYSALKQPMTIIMFLPDKKKFGDDENYTSSSLVALSNIRNNELALIKNFNSAIKAGDAALAKNDCPTAKVNFQKAIALLPDQSYPKERLVLAEKCLKAIEDAKTEAAAKAEAAAAAKAKAETEAKEKADKLAAEKAAKEKAEAEAVAAAKAKAEAEAKEKADKLAAEKVAKEKAEAEAAAAAKAKAETEAKEKAEKLAAEKVAKEKAEAEAAAAAKAKAETEAKEKAEKLAAEKVAKEKADAEAKAAAKAKSEAEAKEKAEKLAAEKVAKEKAEAEAAAAAKAKAETEAKEKAEKLAAEKAAKEKAEAEAAAAAKA